MKRIFITTAILIFTAIFTSPAFAQRQALAGEWTLVRMVRDTWQVPMVSTTGKTPTIKFSSEGFSGNGGCNSYGGSYTVDGGKFTPGPIRSTKMACAGEVNAQESAFFAIMGKADSYQVADYTLTIAGEGGAYSLAFLRKRVEEKPFLWIVDKKKVDCRGIVHQNCLQVKKTDADEWEILREKIVGFKYQPGRYYLIRVKRSMKSVMMANDFIYEYKLVKVISRTRLMPHVD